MPHVFELAASGRATCRGCGRKIAKDEVRFGERRPNAFGDGEMTLWFHPRCAAYKRPEPFLEALESGAPADAAALAALPEPADLRADAERGIEHRRLPRLAGAARAPTGRARCRSCREPIGKDTWRIGLVFFEEYRFEPSGFIHAGCAREYFGTAEILSRVQHFAPELEPADLDALADALGVSG